MLHRRPSFSPPYLYSSLHRIAAAMSAPPPFRGGRGGRRPSSSGVVSGESHFQNRYGNSSNNDKGNDYGKVCFSYDNLNSSSSSRGYSNHSSNNGGFQPQLQSYRPRGAPFHGRISPNQSQSRSKPADYRGWEFAKHPPPSNSERFVVLSYNILADYLANNHRNLYWHIPHRFMSWDWRKRSILFELGLWSADIMCFQEVDKFHEIAEDLKLRGYSGIWKMRTGEPIDGCAIFWRTSKFKLVYEESVEFNKHGMRDNVAQVCVLESLVQNKTDKKSVLSENTEDPKRVVVCNIHVLYNPRRGEIKLGQVRVLLEKAKAVSKKWDDAPVVLCGDFNCVPKSSLYDFISQQKLDISMVDRDKLSGQTSAEIRQPPRQFGRQDRGQSSDNLVNPSTNQNNTFDGKQNDSHSIASRNNQDPEFPSCVNHTDKDVHSGSLSNEPVLLACLTTEDTSKTCSNDRLLPFTDNVNKNTQEKQSRDSCEPAKPAPACIDGPSESKESLIFKNLDEKLGELSLGENEELGNDAEKLSELNEGDAFPSNPNEVVLEDLSSTSESEAVDAATPTYNPSQWTPMEIATATGNPNNYILEHSLKLRSTYTEVEDRSGTRDTVGEPLVTSYNSCFMGTVDYIWRSEGLSTVKVLAPIPKNTLLPSGGFPTKKWGSDHIALATELAFTK